MCGDQYQGWGRGRGHAFFSESTPPSLNYVVVTGELLRGPREGRGAAGDSVFFLEIEFPVAHPELPRFLWTPATYDVEVPGDVGGRDLEGMRRGTPMLVAGQLGKRLSSEDGRASRCGVIVASMVKPGQPGESKAP
jgi:hypothetical protein